jgi:hypothetical protein
MGYNLFFLLIVACPLMMLFMMRGHRGHSSGADGAKGGPADGHAAGQVHSDSVASVEELRRQRTKLDEEIEALGANETRVGGNRR